MANETSIPSLTLDPTAAQAVAQESEEIIEEVKEEVVEAEPEKLELSKLSPEEQAAVLEFSDKIDVTNSEQVLNYGSAAQKNISEFSDAALETVKTKDMGEIGNVLSSLVVELKEMKFDEKEEKGFFGKLFKKGTDNIETLKAQYDSASDNIEKIVEQLEGHEIILMKDISLMDKLFDKNNEYLKELTMYILAGKIRVEKLRNEDLAALQAKAVETGNAEDAQIASDFANLIGRFEKKLYDLELTRMVSLQMSPQIRMIQNNDSLMVEKIRTSINNTIPLWKNQMVLALTMYHSDEAMKAQNEVNNVTNQLLQHNAETLHQGSVAIANEAERGVIDLETLQKTNLELISTLEEVRTIQDTAREKRAAAEIELAKIEGQLKQNLLAMKG